MVGVLVLVDQDVPEPPLVVRGHLREGAEQVDGLPDQVVEVEGVRSGEVAGVLAENLQEHPLGRVVEVRPARVRLHILQLVLQLGYLAYRLARGEAEAVGVELLDDPLDERLAVAGVVDREALGIAEVLRFAAKDAHAGRVERRDPHALGLATHQLLHAFAHLCCGLVGEGDGEDLARPCLLRFEQARDAAGQHAGLAGARAGDDEQRGAAVFDGDALLRIEAFEEGRFARSRRLENEGHVPPILGRAPDRDGPPHPSPAPNEGIPAACRRRAPPTRGQHPSTPSLGTKRGRNPHNGDSGPVATNKAGILDG